MSRKRPARRPVSADPTGGAIPATPTPIPGRETGEPSDGSTQTPTGDSGPPPSDGADPETLQRFVRREPPSRTQ